MAEMQEWYAFADRVEQTAIRMFEVLELPLEDNKRICALTLLARTISNFGSAVALLKIERIVEARILVRCCWENVFYIGRIAKDGQSFIERMINDHWVSTRARGERLFAQKLIERGSEAEEKLREVLRSIDAKGQSLTPKEIADEGPLSEGYLIYMTVSADAAHPTLTSLNRHILENPKTGVIDQLNITASVTPEELVGTIDFGCGALLGACYGVGETLGGSFAAGEVRQRLTEHRRLKGLYD